MRLDESGGLTELASGVDAFYLSGAGSLSPVFLDDLTRARDAARETGASVPLWLGDNEFRVGATGVQRYGFRLDHPFGMVAFTTSLSLPAVRVQPRAAFLHGAGVEGAIEWFTGLLEGVMGAVMWKTSRVDLFVDSHGWDLVADDRGRFVCRANQRVTHEDNELFTGLRFGSGKSGAVMARIYDKTEEVRIKGTDWWPAKWGELYQPGERVLRVEFQVGRELLREVGVSTPEEVLAHLPGLWGYLTDGWLTFRVPNGDRTRSRWPVAPEWRDVQHASLRSDAVGLERIQTGQLHGSIRRLLPALRGYMAAAGAILGARTLEETLHRLNRLIRADEQLTGVSFESRLAEKRIALGLS